jgi:IclR family KDG regulon transcriptional repressor
MRKLLGSRCDRQPGGIAFKDVEQSENATRSEIHAAILRFSVKQMANRKTPWDRSSSIEKACDLLRCFTPLKPSWSLSELARHLGFTKSGVFRIVRTLEGKGFLRRHENSKEYGLGSCIMELTGTVVGERKRLCERAAPYLRHINKRCGFLASLRTIERDEIVILDRVEGTHPLKVVYPIGTHQPCNHGAPGKLLLAYTYSDDEIRELLRLGKIKKLTERTKTDFKELQLELRKIRRLGYAESDGESIRGTVGLAAPVWLPTGRVGAALCITAPESLCPLKRLKVLIPMLKQAAAGLSRDLGYRQRIGAV